MSIENNVVIQRKSDSESAMIDEETSGFLEDANENDSDSSDSAQKAEHVPKLRRVLKKNLNIFK